MKRTVKQMLRGWMAAPMVILAASLTLAASGVRAADDGAQLGPQELVTKVAQDTLKDLDSHRSEYKQNPKRVRELVDKNMLPYFDTAYSAQLVLAKHWRTATPEQRKRFVEAFYQSLLQPTERCEVQTDEGQIELVVITYMAQLYRSLKATDW